jgi:hypothetical protein
MPSLADALPLREIYLQITLVEVFMHGKLPLLNWIPSLFAQAFAGLYTALFFATLYAMSTPSVMSSKIN